MGMPELIHHVPDDDVIAHEPSPHCVCGPYRESVGIRYVGRTGQHVIALIHPRLDGKES